MSPSRSIRRALARAFGRREKFAEARRGRGRRADPAGAPGRSHDFEARARTAARIAARRRAEHDRQEAIRQRFGVRSPEALDEFGKRAA